MVLVARRLKVVREAAGGQTRRDFWQRFRRSVDTRDWRSLTASIPLEYMGVYHQRCSPFLGGGQAQCNCPPIFLSVVTISIPTAAHPLHSLISSSTAASSCHVPDIDHSPIFLTLPSNLPCCIELLPKADQERPSCTSPYLPAAILQLY